MKTKIVLSVLLAVSVTGCILLTIYSALLSGNLRITKQDLLNTQSSLEDVRVKLSNTQANLTAIEGEFKTAQDNLQTFKNNLAVAESQLSNTKSQLQETKLNLNDVSEKLNSSVTQIAKVFNDYSILRTQINKRLGYETESKSYITPENPAVIVKVKEITGSFSEDSGDVWDGYEKLYQWVINNIEYSLDSSLPILPVKPDGSITWKPEFWRMPEETIIEKAGDCEDMATLLASMLLAYTNQKYSVWLIEIEDAVSGHLAVAFPVVGGRLCILDPAGHYYTGYAMSFLSSDTITNAVHDWLDHWSIDMPNAQVCASFSDTFYREFNTTEEFIGWAKNQ